MKEVTITFRNIQSHEYTRFILKPGLNFILGEGNNIGKSTIFNTIIDVAMGSKQPSWISRLIRNGTNRACATFEFMTDDGQLEQINTWFVLQKPGNAYMFYEQSFNGCDPVRLTECPKSLIDALGLAISPSVGLINFNSADSTQLLARSTNESDAVISAIMKDEDVDKVKDNLYNLSNVVVNDHHALSSKIEATQEILSKMSYNTAVDDFFAEATWIEAACRIADSIPADMTREIVEPVSVDETDLEFAKAALGLLQGLLNIPRIPATKEELGIDGIDVGLSVLSKLEQIDTDALRMCSVSDDDMKELKSLYFTARKLKEVCDELSKIRECVSLISRDRDEAEYIIAEMYNNSKTVTCPIKGEVLFTDEKCVSVGDRSSL